MSVVRTGWLALIACGALTAIGASRPAAAASPLEVYGRLPHIEDLALSPDGTRVAFVRTEGDERFVAVVNLDTGFLVGKVHAGDQKLRDIEWADDRHLLIETSVTDVPHGAIFAGNGIGEFFQLQVYEPATGKVFMVPRPNLGGDLMLMNILIGEVTVRRVKDHAVLFVPAVRIASAMSSAVLIAVNLDTQGIRPVAQARVNHWNWTVDGDGEVVAEETYEQRSGRWSILVRRSGAMQEAAAGVGLIDVPNVRGLGPTPGTLLVESLEGHEHVWRLLSLKDGSLGEPLAERRTLVDPIEDRTTGRMIGGVQAGDTAEPVFFDPGVEQSWKTAVRAFPDERVDLVSASATYRRMIVRVEGRRDGYVYELVDLGTHRAEALGDVYEGIHEPHEVRRITYAAADGLEIPAYLTLPRGKQEQHLPLIVLPHGGPAARDALDFNWWAQALADQGYAVLQPNYRGSAIGRAFLERGFGEWGRKMQTDLSDGVRFLSTQGIVDPARVCIVGGSYGGYAALAGVSLDPGVYRCAVSVAGLSDLHRMLVWVNDRQHASSANFEQRYWDRFMGLSGPDDPAADAISPVKHLDAINVPVLLIHGKDDTVVPFEQSQEMYAALHDAHKDVELVALAGEDHWLSRSATRLKMLESSVAFLRAHNPPDP